MLFVLLLDLLMIAIILIFTHLFTWGKNEDKIKKIHAITAIYCISIYLIYSLLLIGYTIIPKRLLSINFAKSVLLYNDIVQKSYKKTIQNFSNSICLYILFHFFFFIIILVKCSTYIKTLIQTAIFLFMIGFTIRANSVSNDIQFNYKKITRQDLNNDYINWMNDKSKINYS